MVAQQPSGLADSVLDFKPSTEQQGLKASAVAQHGLGYSPTASDSSSAQDGAVTLAQAGAVKDGSLMSTAQQAAPVAQSTNTAPEKAANTPFAQHANVPPEVPAELAPEATSIPAQTAKPPRSIAGVTGKDLLEAIQKAGQEYAADAKETKATVQGLSRLPFLKGGTLVLSLDHIASLLFYCGVAGQVLFSMLFIRLLSLSFLWLVLSSVVGLAGGLALSYMYYKNRRDKSVTNTMLSMKLGSKGVQHLLGYLPSWFQLSEREKLEWLNSVIGEMWPFIDKAVCNTVKEITAKETAKVLKENKALGSAVKAIGFKHLTFGGAPFRVEGISVSKHPRHQILVLEVDVRYAGDPNITLAITIPTGQTLCPRVSDIVFVGNLRITLGPLVDKVPGFVAATATFRQQPLIKYRLDFGKALGGSYLGGSITPVINYFVKDTITNMLVWPQRLVVPILSSSEEERLEVQRLQLRSKGVLHVRVIRAKDMPQRDLIGKNDPFVQLTTDLERLETSSVRNGAGLEATWNEDFYLLVQEPESQQMRVSVRDASGITGRLAGVGSSGPSGALVGRCLVKLKEITAEEGMPQEASYHLGSADWGTQGGPGKGCGKILLRSTYRSFESLTSEEVERAPKGILIVRVVQLKRLNPGGQSAVSVMVKVGVEGCKAQPASATTNARKWSVDVEARKLDLVNNRLAAQLLKLALSHNIFEEELILAYAASRKVSLEQPLELKTFRKLMDWRPKNAKEAFRVGQAGKDNSAASDRTTGGKLNFLRLKSKARDKEGSVLGATRDEASESGEVSRETGRGKLSVDLGAGGNAAPAAATSVTSPLRDRLAQVVSQDPALRAVFVEYERNKMRIEKAQFDTDLDFTLDQGATLVFYEVTQEAEIKVSVVEKKMTASNEKLGGMSIAVGEVIAARDYNLFSGKKESGYLHKRWDAPTHLLDSGDTPACIDIIARFVPHLRHDANGTY